MELNYLDRINSPEDLRRICESDPDAVYKIAEELRSYIIEVVTLNGGHLASNLGVIEITLALHLIFKSPMDTIVFDVGHQSYAHKILTGRRDEFITLRKKDGISGFPKRSESEHDAFNAGHSSTSISAALGIARAKKLKGDISHTIAVIGDGSITGGMAFEALNDVGQSELPLIVLLNDNEMAISNTVGALGTHLSKLRTSRKYLNFKRSTSSFLKKIPLVGDKLSLFLEKLKNKIKYFIIPDVIFESMGLTYIGPIDGHDIKALQKAFLIAERSERPVLIHSVTVKGKGYPPAETDAEKYHGISGRKAAKSANSNSKIIGETLCSLAREDGSIAAVTAAMLSGTGLMPFSKEFPDRFFDVGIAEQHAVTMAAGAATKGLKPFVAIYSTFLQRAYDQILHDVCLQKLPVVFGVDRAGLVGDDGETHQGVYDIAYLLTMPNMTIMSPATTDELKAMTELAFKINRPVAIRYNRGCLPERETKVKVVFGRWEIINPVSEITVVATGRLVETARKVADKFYIGLVNARFINPIDYSVMGEIKNKARIVITLEDGIASAGFGVKITQKLSEDNIAVYNMGVPHRPIPQGSIKEQDEMCCISEESLIKRLKELNAREK